MKRLLAVAALLVLALWTAWADKPRVSHAALAAVEKIFDSRIQHANPADPLDLLGNTRGIYLAGYGAVFTTAVDLIVSPTLSPFRPAFSKEELARIHHRKLERLPLLRKNMRDMLVSTAAALDMVPANEQVVIGVTLFYFSWEDTSGLPSQIVMQAERQKLLGRTVADNVIHTEEF